MPARIAAKLATRNGPSKILWFSLLTGACLHHTFHVKKLSLSITLGIMRGPLSVHRTSIPLIIENFFARCPTPMGTPVPSSDAKKLLTYSKADLH